MVPLLAIGREPLELDHLIAAVSARADEPAGSDGAVVTFLGLVRNHNVGRRVRYLEYEAYEPLALKTFERIAAEVRERWPGVRLALHHRVGRLEIGEASVAIAAASAHRGRRVTPPAATRSSASSRSRRSGSASSSRAATSGSKARSRIRPTSRPAPRRSGSHARDRPVVRAAARHRRARRSWRATSPRRDDRQRVAAARRRVSGAGPYERSISSAVNADYARMDTPLRDGDEVAFLPPVSGDDGDRATASPSERPISLGLRSRRLSA